MLGCDGREGAVFTEPVQLRLANREPSTVHGEPPFFHGANDEVKGLHPRHRRADVGVFEAGLQVSAAHTVFGTSNACGYLRSSLSTDAVKRSSLSIDAAKKHEPVSKDGIREEEDERRPRRQKRL